MQAIYQNVRSDFYLGEGHEFTLRLIKMYPWEHTWLPAEWIESPQSNNGQNTNIYHPWNPDVVF